MSSGCVELVQLLIDALPTAKAREQSLQAALTYASRPGAALPLDALRATSGGAATGHQTATGRVRPHVDAPPDEAPAGCAEGGGWDVAPPPTPAERAGCDLEQVSRLHAPLDGWLRYTKAPLVVALRPYGFSMRTRPYH